MLTTPATSRHQFFSGGIPPAKHHLQKFGARGGARWAPPELVVAPRNGEQITEDPERNPVERFTATRVPVQRSVFSGIGELDVQQKPT
jgi:hypothetical protein